MADDNGREPARPEAGADVVAADPTAVEQLSHPGGWSWKPVISFVALAAVWQIAAMFSPPYLFPGLDVIARSLLKILGSWDLMSQGLITWARLGVAVAGSLVIGIPIGIAMGMAPAIDDYLRPIVKFIMGVPALNWVIIVIIWFTFIELRIVFVLLMICTPITVFCVYDGVRSIDARLFDMVKSFGASPFQVVRLLLWPFVKAFAFTAAKLNIGVAVRTVIVAELVGAPSGIGKELDLAKNVFDMGMVMGWTLWMVLMLLLMQWGIEQFEHAALRWRTAHAGHR